MKTWEEQNKKMNKGQNGFIKIIVLLVIILLIASLFGFSPEVVWDKFILPAVGIMWKIAVWGANLLKPFFNIFVDIIRIVIDLFNRAWH